MQRRAIKIGIKIINRNVIRYMKESELYVLLLVPAWLNGNIFNPLRARKHFFYNLVSSFIYYLKNDPAKLYNKVKKTLKFKKQNKYLIKKP